MQHYSNRIQSDSIMLFNLCAHSASLSIDVYSLAKPRRHALHSYLAGMHSTHIVLEACDAALQMHLMDLIR